MNYGYGESNVYNQITSGPQLQWSHFTEFWNSVWRLWLLCQEDCIILVWLCLLIALIVMFKQQSPRLKNEAKVEVPKTVSVMATWGLLQNESILVNSLIKLPNSRSQSFWYQNMFWSQQLYCCAPPPPQLFHQFIRTPCNWCVSFDWQVDAVSALS